jgi:YidC/Oxa1 family membrane protein insertase
LRQASFLWIEDLTQPDRLFPIGITLPLLITNFSLDFFNLLPILYVALTVINQRLQPRPQDPQMLAQYRMMSFMLVFLGFIFYHFPAGFMLYIMTSAALGIGESKYIKWRLAKEDGAPGTSGAAGSPTPAVEAAYPSRVRSDGAPPPSRSFQGGQPRSRRRGRR